MIYGGGIVALALLLFWVYCIFDVISSDDGLTRNLPKFVWLLVVIFLPTIGSVAWLALGRPPRPVPPAGDLSYRRPPNRLPPGPKGPEDSPGFMAGLDDRTRELKRWEDDLKRREEELRKRREGND